MIPDRFAFRLSAPALLLLLIVFGGVTGFGAARPRRGHRSSEHPAGRRAALRVRRTDERRPHLGGGRGRRQARRVLRRRGVGRRLEIVDGGATWKPTFDNETSQAIGALAVAPIESEHRVGRHRRRLGRARHGHDGRRHLQVDRRRRDLDEHGPHRDRPHRHASSCIRPTRTSSSPARSAARPVRSRSAASFRTEDGGKTWQHVLFVEREHRLLRPADVAEGSRTS